MFRIREDNQIRWTFERDRPGAEVIRKRKGGLTFLIGKSGGELTDCNKNPYLYEYIPGTYGESSMFSIPGP